MIKWCSGISNGLPEKSFHHGDTESTEEKKGEVWRFLFLHFVQDRLREPLSFPLCPPCLRGFFSEASNQWSVKGRWGEIEW